MTFHFAGSLFALEVLHRQGLQFFEISIFGIACGTICLVVYRGLSMMPFGQVWYFPQNFPIVDFRHVLIGKVLHWAILTDRNSATQRPPLGEANVAISYPCTALRSNIILLELGIRLNGSCAMQAW